MKTKLTRTLILSMLTLLLFNISVNGAENTNRVDSWVTRTFAKNRIPPFSFTLGGVSSSSFIRKWRYSFSRNIAEGQLKYTVSYVDPATGLKVECSITGYEDFNAVDWVLHFTNGGETDSPPIKDIKALDYSYVSDSAESFILEHIKGSEARFDDFMPFSDTLTADSTLFFSPLRGRSSDGMAAPFFNLRSSGGKGVVLAVGWTGTWFAEMTKLNDRTVSLASGMKNIDTFLYPGETMRTPLISMMFWEGSEPMAGNNKFRRFMLAHNMRKTNGQNSSCPVFASIGWGDPAPCTVRTGITEEIAKCNIHRFKQFDIKPDVFWMDAGWYTRNAVHDRQKNWHYTAGTWRPDPERFPEGLRPVADEVHKEGARFLVWFEPERANNGSQVWELHPEWLLSKPGDDFYHLFDFGNEEAKDWMCRYIGDFIEESGIDYYRQDLCLHPAPYWEANDEPGRTGMKELRHIEGLYSFLDYLLDRFPNMLIDNCASGGHRLDIEMYRRSVPLWRTDFTGAESCEAAQSHTYGLSFFLPVHGISTKNMDDYHFLSRISSTTLFTTPLFNNPELDLWEYWEKLSLYREIQPYFYESYYPLSGVENLEGHDIWLAYQYHKPSNGTGIVAIFRRKDAPETSYEIHLEALDPEGMYEVVDVFRNKTVICRGEELSRGLSISMDTAPGAILLRYSLCKTE